MSARCDPEVAATSAWRSADPREASRAYVFNYMSHPDDWADMRACVRLTREIFAQPAFDRFRGDELQPGAGVLTDGQIDAFVAAKVESAYHPSGTCRMGRADTSTDPRSARRQGLRRTLRPGALALLVR